MEQKINQAKSSEPKKEEKKEDPGGFIIRDKINPYKLMLVADLTKVSRLQALGLAEEFKEQAKFLIIQRIEEKRRLCNINSKFNIKGFLNKKLW